MKQNDFVQTSMTLEAVAQAPPLHVEQRPGGTSKPAVRRDDSLDFIKGVLVIVMVIYHAMDYFMSGSANLYAYIHFVSGAFIFMAGYVVANFYKDKFVQAPNRTTWRLITRGLKLIALFTVANLAINFLQVQNFNKVQFGIQLFMQNLIPIFVYGNGRYSTFEVLLPIAYLLILSPLVLLGYKRFHKYELALVIAAIAACWAFHVRVTGPSLVIVGLTGFMIGTFATRIDRAPAWSQVVNAILLSTYIVLLPYISLSFATYVLNIVLVVKFFHDLSRYLNLSRGINRVLVLFGQYSLFCYLAQIVFLQIVFRGLVHHRWPFGYQIFAVAFAACVALAIGCLVLERAKSESRLVNSAYKLIFA